MPPRKRNVPAGPTMQVGLGAAGAKARAVRTSGKAVGKASAGKIAGAGSGRGADQGMPMVFRSQG